MDMNNEIRKRKCHGNRKNQRFRKRCRARGMKPATIAKLLERRNRLNMMTGPQQTNNHTTITTTIPFDTSSQQRSYSIETTNNSHKRKRIMSIQDLRADQATTTSTKKMKKKTEKMSLPLVQVNEKRINKIFRYVLVMDRIII